MGWLKAHGIVARSIFNDGRTITLVNVCARHGTVDPADVQLCVPMQFSRGLVGRMMADPAFLQKLAMEQAITISSSLWWEAQQRGDRFSKVCSRLILARDCIGVLVQAVRMNRMMVVDQPWLQLCWSVM